MKKFSSASQKEKKLTPIHVLNICFRQRKTLGINAKPYIFEL